MTTPIDVAYVDVVVRDKSLDKLERDIDKTFDDIDRNIEKDLGKIDERFDDLFKRIDEGFDDLTRQVDSTFENIVDTLDDAVFDIENNFTRTEEHAQRSFKRIANAADDAFDDVDTKFVNPLRRGFDKLGDIISSVGTTLGQLGGGLGGFVSKSPLLALILALTPAIIALAAALSQLIGLVGILPSGLGVLLAAIIPVVIAFQNFGDAVGAIAEGDIEKIDEAMKKLSVSAQFVAREVGAALPFLRQFQRSLQESFFGQLRGAFTQLVGVLPLLGQNLGRITASVGQLVRGFINLATTPKTIATLNALFDSTSKIIDRIAPTLIRFFDAIGSTVSASLPFVERLATAFGNALDKFSAFIDKSVDSGAFNQFIEDAFTTVKELVALLKALGGLIGTIFAGTEDAGHGFLKTLTDLTIRLDDFLKTAEGQDTLKTLVLAVKLLGAALGATLTILTFLVRSQRDFLLFLEKIGKGATEVATKVGDFLAAVPEKIVTFFRALPDQVIGFVNRMIDGALNALGVGIGLILFNIQVLPGRIIEFLGTLPDRVHAIFLRFSQIILGFITSTVNDGRNTLTSGFDAIVEFIKSIPDRIVALGPIFLNAGKNLIQSFMNGFKSVGGFIGDVAGSIVASVKGFLNRAIDRINEGIATIDNVLPGSLFRIPRLAGGALVKRRPGGILANIGEGNEDEWVLPESKLQSLVNNSAQSITFGPGAINVSFSGVIPTEDEARTVGQAVGQGIISTIARRDLRAQVRAM